MRNNRLFEHRPFGRFFLLLIPQFHAEMLRDFVGIKDVEFFESFGPRFVTIGDGKIIAAGSMADMQASQHPWLRAYFHGKRARAVTG